MNPEGNPKNPGRFQTHFNKRPVVLAAERPELELNLGLKDENGSSPFNSITNSFGPVTVDDTILVSSQTPVTSSYTPSRPPENPYVLDSQNAFKKGIDSSVAVVSGSGATEPNSGGISKSGIQERSDLSLEKPEKIPKKIQRSDEFGQSRNLLKSRIVEDSFRSSLNEPSMDESHPKKGLEDKSEKIEDKPKQAVVGLKDQSKPQNDGLGEGESTDRLLKEGVADFLNTSLENRQEVIEKSEEELEVPNNILDSEIVNEADQIAPEVGQFAIQEEEGESENSYENAENNVYSDQIKDEKDSRTLLKSKTSEISHPMLKSSTARFGFKVDEENEGEATKDEIAEGNDKKGEEVVGDGGRGAETGRNRQEGPGDGLDQRRERKASPGEGKSGRRGQGYPSKEKGEERGVQRRGQRYPSNEKRKGRGGRKERTDEEGFGDQTKGEPGRRNRGSSSPHKRAKKPKNQRKGSLQRGRDQQSGQDHRGGRRGARPAQKPRKRQAREEGGDNGAVDGLNRPFNPYKDRTLLKSYQELPPFEDPIQKEKPEDPQTPVHSHESDSENQAPHREHESDSENQQPHRDQDNDDQRTLLKSTGSDDQTIIVEEITEKIIIIKAPSFSKSSGVPSSGSHTPSPTQEDESSETNKSSSHKTESNNTKNGHHRDPKDPILTKLHWRDFEEGNRRVRSNIVVEQTSGPNFVELDYVNKSNEYKLTEEIELDLKNCSVTLNGRNGDEFVRRGGRDGDRRIFSYELKLAPMCNFCVKIEPFDRFFARNWDVTVKKSIYYIDPVTFSEDGIRN